MGYYLSINGELLTSPSIWLNKYEITIEPEYATIYPYEGWFIMMPQMEPIVIIRPTQVGKITITVTEKESMKMGKMEIVIIDSSQ